MQESSKYAVGIDIGTTAVRIVVGQIEYENNSPIITIVGVSKVPNSGLRKGVVVNLVGPSQATDEALGEVERISGHKIDDATISINGAHILTTKTDGMIALRSHRANKESFHQNRPVREMPDQRIRPVEFDHLPVLRKRPSPAL